MRLTFVGIALLAGTFVSPPAGPGTCPRDSKLVNGGPTAVYGEGPGTWWGLVIDGLNAAGLDTVAEKIAWLNECFGTTFDDLDDLKEHNQNLISDLDKNKNGYVCAWEIRGTRASIDLPFVNLVYHGVSDDHAKKN
jgi:hypothetical protein